MLRFSGGRGSILDDGVEFDDGDTIVGTGFNAIVGDASLICLLHCPVLYIRHITLHFHFLGIITSKQI